MSRIAVPYAFGPTDTHTVWLGLSMNGRPPTYWKPAVKDTIDGRQVVWANFDVGEAKHAWVKDAAGVRLVLTVPLKQPG